MQRQPRRDTAGELALRSALHRLGLRFRVDCRPEPTWRRRADIVFRRALVAVFFDGCFWHGCRLHQPSPRAHKDWWVQKIERNRIRDLDTTAKLKSLGWRVVRVWEHEPTASAVAKVLAVLQRRHRAGNGHPGTAQ